MKSKAPIFDVLVLSAILACFALSYLWAQFLYSPISTAATPRYLYIESGMTASDVLGQLKKQQLIHHPVLWKILLYLKQADKKLHAGEFEINHTTSPLALLEHIVAGEVVQYSLTFIEGSTLTDWIKLLKTAPLTHTVQPDNLADLMKQLSIATSLEGWLYPDTYFFPKGTEDLVLLKKLLPKCRRC